MLVQTVGVYTLQFGNYLDNLRPECYLAYLLILITYLCFF